MENQLILSQIPVNDLVDQIAKKVSAQIKEDKHKEFEERLMSPAETCKLFTPKISLPTLNRWTKAGLLKLYRIGGRTYYKYSEVLPALNEGSYYNKTILSNRAIDITELLKKLTTEQKFDLLSELQKEKSQSRVVDLSTLTVVDLLKSGIFDIRVAFASDDVRRKTVNSLFKIRRAIRVKDLRQTDLTQVNGFGPMCLKYFKRMLLENYAWNIPE